MCVLQGRKVFARLKHLESRGVSLQVAVNAPQTSSKETAELAATGTNIQNVSTMFSVPLPGIDPCLPTGI